MKTISSRDNPTYRSALRLLRKKYRDSEGRYLIEGVKPVIDALDAGIALDAVFVSESSDALIPEDSYSVIKLSDSLFQKLADTETSQGLIAVARKRTDRDLAGHNIIVLDRLQDPGNIGTVIRTAEAAGFAVITVKGTGDVYSPKVVRAAAGSLFRVPILEGLETDEAIAFCRNSGLDLAVTALEGAKDCYSTDLTGCALVIGNEGSGVSREFLDAADKTVKIPMKGEIESLNAAVAAGVLMFESTRQASTAGKVR